MFPLSIFQTRFRAPNLCTASSKQIRVQAGSKSTPLAMGTAIPNTDGQAGQTAAFALYRQEVARCQKNVTDYQQSLVSYQQKLDGYQQKLKSYQQDLARTRTDQQRSTTGDSRSPLAGAVCEPSRITVKGTRSTTRSPMLVSPTTTTLRVDSARNTSM